MLLAHRGLRTQTAIPQNSIALALQANSAGLSTTTATAANAVANQVFSQTYTNMSLGFSFKYPAGLKAGTETSQSTGSVTVLVQNPSTHLGFQLYITPYSGSSASVTAAHVAQDLPNIDMRDAQGVVIAGAPGVTFLATDPNFGNSRQVWFVHKGYLYQASTYSSQGSLLGKVLSAWAFSK